MADQKQKPKWHVSERQRSNARALRCDMTVAERIIRYNARAHRFRGIPRERLGEMAIWRLWAFASFVSTISMS